MLIVFIIQQSKVNHTASYNWLVQILLKEGLTAVVGDNDDDGGSGAWPSAAARAQEAANAPAARHTVRFFSIFTLAMNTMVFKSYKNRWFLKIGYVLLK